MRSVNKVILIGNLTRDPEVRQTPNGQSVTTFGIATNREWVTRDSQRHTSSEFHEIVAWSKLAEICGKFLKKGKLIYIEGYLKTRSWDTPEGIKKFKTEIVIQDMIMLEKRQEGDYAGEPDYIPDENAQQDNQMDATTAPHQDIQRTPAPKIAPRKMEPKIEKVEEKEPVAASAPSKSAGPIDIDDDLGL